MNAADAIAELVAQGSTGEEAAAAFAAMTGLPCLHVYHSFDRDGSNVNVHVHDPDGSHDVAGTDLDTGDPTWPAVEALFRRFAAGFAAEEGGEGSDGTGVMPLEDFVAYFKKHYNY